MISKNSQEQPFSQIHAQELLEIKKRREKQSYDTTEIDASQPDLVGLALSGGGIRSATFCLGFLQELQRLRLLRIFDYLSTVSGGGYLGGWWSAWLSRRQEDITKAPAFAPDDISDPVSLLKRSLESEDPVAQDLLVHLQSSARGQKLLSVLQRADLRQLTPLLYEPLADEKGLTLRVEAQSAMVHANREMISQALANLIDNAIKYAGENAAAVPADGGRPEIVLSAETKDDHIQIAVADSGPGIPETERGRVIERFVRLEQSRSMPGSGLGLSLVSAVARLHGGELKLEDNGPGLKAIIELPRVAAHGAA